MIKDEFTEPHHPQQNPVETEAIRYIKNQVLKVLDNSGAPESTWYFAAQYVADVHNICADSRLPDHRLLISICMVLPQTYLHTFSIPFGNLSCSLTMKLFGLQPMRDLEDGLVWLTTLVMH